MRPKKRNAKFAMLTEPFAEPERALFIPRTSSLDAKKNNDSAGSLSAVRD